MKWSHALGLYLGGAVAAVIPASGQSPPGLISDPIGTVEVRSFCGKTQLLPEPPLTEIAATALEKGCGGPEKPSQLASCFTLLGLQRMSEQRDDYERALLAARQLYRDSRDAWGAMTVNMVLAEAAHARRASGEADGFLAEASAHLAELGAGETEIPRATWILHALVRGVPVELFPAFLVDDFDFRKIMIRTTAASLGSLRAVSLACQGKYEESEAAAERTLELIAEAPNFEDEGRLHELVGWLRERQGLDAKAAERYNVALAKALESEHPGQILSVALRLVELLARNKRVQEAHSVITQAMSSAELVPYARVILRIEQAILHARSGHIEPINALIRDIVELAESESESEPRTQAGALMVTGNRLHMLGFNQQAAAALEAALPLLLRCTGPQVPFVHEKLRYVLVEVHSELGLRDSIEHHLSELERLVAVSGRQEILVSARWAASKVLDDLDVDDTDVEPPSLVEIAAGQGVDAKAIEELEQFEEFGDRMDATETVEEMLEVFSEYDYSHLADLFRRVIEGDGLELLEIVRELSIEDASDGHRKPLLKEALNLAIHAATEAFLGDVEVAATKAREAVSRLESFLALNDVDAIASAIVDGRGHEVFELAALALFRVDVEEAFEVAERGRALTLRRSLGSSRSQRVDQSPAAARVLAQISNMESANGSSASASSELASMRRQYHRLRLEAELRAVSAAERAAMDPPSVDTLRRDVLGDDTTLVAYLTAGDDLTAWVVSPTSADVTAVPMAETVTFSDHVARLSRGASTGESATDEASGTGSYRQRRAARAAEDLYDSLIAPIEKWLVGRKLVIIPTGTLHGVPFAGLRNRRTGRFLLEDYTLRFAPSTAALVGGAPRGAPPKTAALVMGDAITPRSRLSGARREVETVADLLGTEPVLGPDATESRFYEMAPRARLLHIATHGEYLEGTPYFNRLLLSPEPGHDGALEVHEILDRLDLAGTDLVVLSACETASGSVSRGDDVTSLAQSFMLAGSRNVISTLWRVSDRASADLMVAFYRELLQNRKPAAEALRAAQLEMLAEPATAAPYFWAGYQLSGSGDLVVTAQ